MPDYLVSVYDSQTWRKKEQMRITATNIGLASYRAFKEFKLTFKGKRFTEISIKARKV